MTEGLNHKVAAVLEEMATQLTALSGIDSSIDAIRGTENLTLVSLNNNISGLRADIADLAEQLSSVLGVREEGDLNTVWIFLDEITTSIKALEDHVGIPTGDATTTVIGYLSTIAGLARCNCPAQPPNLSDPSSPCTDPFVSTPSLTTTAPAYPGRIFAGWQEPAPDGLVITTFLPTPIAPAEIVRSTEVGGWKLYVQSDAHLASLNPTSETLVLTNEWIDIDDASEELAVSVDAPFSLVVYICIPEGAVWTDCIDLDSSEGTYTTDLPFSEDAQFISFTDVPAVGKGNSWSQGGHEQAVTVENSIITSNLHGATITLLSGETVDIYCVDSVGSVTVLPIHAVDDSQTITFDTTVVLVHNLAGSAPTEHPFSIRMCPPA